MTITEILEELNIPFRAQGHEHTRPGWVQVDCPSCSPGWQHWRLGINLHYHYSNCWSCGKLSLPWVLKELSSQPWDRVKELLARLDRVRPEEDRPRGKLILPSGLGPLLPVHRRYLEFRGFDPDELERLWGLQGIELHPRLSWRIFIPVQLHGKTVSWTTRSLYDLHRSRYISASRDEEAVPKEELLFGIDLARHAIIVTEGPFDVMRIGPGAVATLGTSYSQAQVAKIIQFPLRVICFDREPNAQYRAKQLCRMIAPFPGRTVNEVLEAEDPGSASPEEIKELRTKFFG